LLVVVVLVVVVVAAAVVVVVMVVLVVVVVAVVGVVVVVVVVVVSLGTAYTGLVLWLDRRQCAVDDLVTFKKKAMQISDTANIYHDTITTKRRKLLERTKKKKFTHPCRANNDGSFYQ
jgi:biopolymer transport protein ExbB/TolQ